MSDVSCGNVVVAVPPLAASRAWLDAAGPVPPAALDPVLSSQRADGTWGTADDARRRVLPTLWTAAVLAELGLAPSPAWDRAADFLATRATTDDGVFSRDGSRTGVLACYVAISATLFLQGGRRDLAGPQIDWIVRYQDVRSGGCTPFGERPVYDPGLALRYGGCLAATSCLIGVAKAGRALTLWRGGSAHDPRRGEIEAMLAVIREALLARRLMFRTDGGVLPLGTPPARAHEWLAPTFPLDWRTDLIEVLDLVARTGPPDARVQPAVDHLAALELPGGGWPLLRTFWPSGFPALEPRSTRRPSRLATRRVLSALDALAA